jgi:hypothetical protein
MRLLVDVARTLDGRVEGQIRTEDADPWQAFSGVLELLKVLEELLDRDALTPTQTSEIRRETT